MNWLGYISRDHVNEDFIDDIDTLVGNFYMSGTWCLPKTLELNHANICEDIRRVRIIQGGNDWIF